MKNLTLLIFFISLISCNQTTTTSSDTTSHGRMANVDSLTMAFLDGWNAHDSAAIMKTIADNAIVMNDSSIHTGTNAIARNWISGGVKVLSNIQTTSLIKEVGESIAYDGGTYTLDLTPPGGPVLKEEGNYSLVWSKQQSGDWKLTLIHIEDVTRMPDIK